MEGETEAERREGTGSYRVVEELKRVSTDRPLDQGQVSLMHGEVTGSGSGRESAAVSGATGPPVDPPNLSVFRFSRFLGFFLRRPMSPNTKV